jgi:hypothetical protein
LRAYLQKQAKVKKEMEKDEQKEPAKDEGSDTSSDGADPTDPETLDEEGKMS